MPTLLPLLPFTPFTGSYHYAEAVRGKVLMSLVDPTGKELCGRMHCKDFIQDAFLSEREGKASSIYGFRWEPGRLDPSAPTQHLALTYLEKGLLERAKQNLQPFLQAWEKRLGFEPLSTVASADGAPDTLLLTYPKGWTLQPIRFGALTLLIRVATGWDPEKCSPISYMEKVAAGLIPAADLAFTTDPGYVKKALDRFQDMWNRNTGKAAFPAQTWEQYAGKTHDLHHGSGMVSYLRERTP